MTSLTPSIKRRRVSVSATSVWLVAQPLSVKVGMLPGGVAEATVELAVAALLAELEDLVGLTVAVAPVVDPIVPDTEESEAFLGSTRPISWKA